MNSEKATRSGNERVEKTAFGTPESMDLSQLDYELRLLARDSMPILDLNTVRLESVDRQEDGYEIVISGEPIEATATNQNRTQEEQ